MSVKIRKKLKILSLIELAREDFKKELSGVIAPEIIKTLEGGNSPIKAGKQPKYSDSYLKAIAGSKNTKAGSKGAFTPLKENEEGGYKKSKKVSKKGLGFNKLPSPVNLKLSGELHKSIKVNPTEKGLMVVFDDPKAFYHNDLGVGKNKTKRRLLPSNPGEEFNYNIFKRIIDALKKAIRKHV